MNNAPMSEMKRSNGKTWLWAVLVFIGFSLAGVTMQRVFVVSATKEALNDVKNDLKGSICELKTDMYRQIQDLKNDMEKDLKEIREEILRLQHKPTREIKQ